MSGTTTTTPAAPPLPPAPALGAALTAPAAAPAPAASKIFSPSKVAFFAPELQAVYAAAGTWPADGVAVTNAVWQTYIAQPPTGQMLGAVNGKPGWVAKPAPPPPTPAQAAATALAGGLAITCATVPAVNGTYAADAATVSHVQSEILSILLNGSFTGGGSTLSWPDAAGALHVFPDVGLFKAFATALAAFVGQCAQFASGAVTALPSASVAIVDPSAA